MDLLKIFLEADVSLLTEGVDLRPTDYGTDLHNKKTVNHRYGDLKFFESQGFYFAIHLGEEKNSNFSYRVSDSFSENYDDYIATNDDVRKIPIPSFMNALGKVFFVLLDLGKRLNKKTIHFIGNSKGTKNLYPKLMSNKLFIEKVKQFGYDIRISKDNDTFIFINVDYHGR